MSGDSRATFTSSIEKKIRDNYHNRCAICLNRLPEVSVQSANLIDAASARTAISLRLLSEEYQRSSVINGMAQCPTCHIAYFTPDLIALSPPIPILRYILEYIVETPTNQQLPLHEVFALLRLAMTGASVPLPDPTSILPYLGLFVIVTLKPEDLVNCYISTQHLPTLSVLQDGHFVPASSTISPADENAVRIFDINAVSIADPAISLGTVPLSSTDPEFLHQRYWRVPVHAEAVLTVLINRVGFNEFDHPEINLAQLIASNLFLQQHTHTISGRIGLGGRGPSGGGSGPSGGPSCGGPSDGPSGGQSRIPQRFLDYNDRTKSTRTKRGSHEGLDECDVKSSFVERDEPELSDRSASPERTHHGVDPKQWEVASSFSAIVENESVHTRSPSENSESASTSISRGAASEAGTGVSPNPYSMLLTNCPFSKHRFRRRSQYMAIWAIV